MSTALTPAQKKQADVRRNLRSVLERGAQEFAAVLPRHITPERMIRVAMTACTVQPKLLDCSQESVGLALLAASQTGLEPDGYHAHLVPYGNTCQFIPDYKGLVQLALEHDVVIDAYCVHEKDHFKYQLGTSPCIEHVPDESEDRGPLRCAYAVATFPNGRTKFVVATRAEIDKRRKSSPGALKADSPWKKWEESMWQKTAVKMLMKYVPRSQRLRAAIIHDDMAEVGVQQTPMVLDAASAATRPLVSTRESKMGKLARSMAPEGEPQHPGPRELFRDALESSDTVEHVMEAFNSIIVPVKEQLDAEDYEAAYNAAQARISELGGNSAEEGGAGGQ